MFMGFRGFMGCRGFIGFRGLSVHRASGVEGLSCSGFRVYRVYRV